MEEFEKLQEAVVFTIAQSLDDEWIRVVVNYEMLYHDDYIEQDRLGFCITSNTDGELSRRDLEFTPEIEHAFINLNDASVRVNKQHWAVCDLVIDSNGKYEMKFGYEPRRIDAILDEESYFRFGKYLETYKASLKKT